MKSTRPEVLRTAVAGVDGLPGDREWACFGVHAEVLEPGPPAVGDAVHRVR